MVLLDNSLIKSRQKSSFEKFLQFRQLIIFGACFLKYVYRTVRVSLWKSESLTSRVSELQKPLGIFANNRSITFGLSGFLKHVGFFIKFFSDYKLQNCLKLGSVISALKSPGNKKFS